MAKQTTAITVDVFGDTMTLTFSNGKELSVNTATLSPEIAKQALMHGLKQKLVDAAAIARNPETGASATVMDKYEAVRTVFERITHPTSPTWNKGREGGENGKKGAGSLLVQALVNLSQGKHTREFVEQFLSTKTKAQQKAMQNSERVAAEIARIRGSNGTADDLLGELLSNETDDNDDVTLESADEENVEREEEEADIEPEPVAKPAPKARSKKAVA